MNMKKIWKNMKKGKAVRRDRMPEKLVKKNSKMQGKKNENKWKWKY